MSMTLFTKGDKRGTVKIASTSNRFIVFALISDEKWKNMQVPAHSDDIITTLRSEATERSLKGDSATGAVPSWPTSIPRSTA